MEIDFSQTLKDMRGDPAQIPGPNATKDDPKLEPLTLGGLCALALNVPANGDNQGQVNLKRGRLVSVVYEGAVVDMAPEDLTIIRAAILQMPGTSNMVISQAHDLLGGSSPE